MTNEEILKKAVKKAGRNGFKIKVVDYNGIVDFGRKVEELMRIYYQIIFNHDFAKAFWGEQINGTRKELINPPNNYRTYKVHIPAWQYHLQQMVLEGEPLKYIEKFL